MTASRNPQADEIAHESMVRNLAAQAEAVWPQEREIVARYPAPDRVLDVGCGTGEIARRVAELFPGAIVTAADLHRPHLQRGKQVTERVDFVQADAFHLPVADRTFDLTLCRHMLQMVPEPLEVLREMMRVTREGGRLHVLGEDYAMMHFHPTRLDCDRFWHEGPMVFARSTGTDLRVGRAVFTMLKQLGARDLRVDYVVLDTLRAPRETFAAIWEAWRDGYSDSIVRNSRLTREEVRAYWEDMIASIRNPEGYGVWFIPIVGGTV